MKKFKFLQSSFNITEADKPGATLRYVVGNYIYALCLTPQGEFQLSYRDLKNTKHSVKMPAGELFDFIQKRRCLLCDEEHAIFDELVAAGYPCLAQKGYAAAIYRLATERDLLLAKQDSSSEIERQRRQLSGQAKHIEALMGKCDYLQSYIDKIQEALRVAGLVKVGDAVQQIQRLIELREYFKDEMFATQDRYNIEFEKLQELAMKQAREIEKLKSHIDGIDAVLKADGNSDSGDHVSQIKILIDDKHKFDLEVQRQRELVCDQAKTITRLRCEKIVATPLLDVKTLHKLFEADKLVRCVNCTRLRWGSVIKGKGTCTMRHSRISLDIYCSRDCNNFRMHHGATGELRELQRITAKSKVYNSL